MFLLVSYVPGDVLKPRSCYLSLEGVNILLRDMEKNAEEDDKRVARKCRSELV